MSHFAFLVPITRCELLADLLLNYRTILDT